MRLSLTSAALFLALVAVSPLSARADDIQTHIQKANAAAEKKEWDVVLSELDAVLAIDKNNIAAHSGKAVVLVQKQDFKGAIAELDQVILLDPKNAGAYNMRASLYQQTGDKAKFEADYVQFLRLSPDDAAQMRADAQAATDKADWDHAASLWSLLAQVFPDDARVLYARGVALNAIVPDFIMHNIGQDNMQDGVDKINADAKASFQAAIKADPKFVPPYIALNDPPLIEQGLKLSPDSPELLVAHANSTVTLAPTADQIKSALADYTHALQGDPKNVAALAGRAFIYKLNHQYDLALADSNQALELKPDDASLLATRADIYEAQNDYEHAAADYDRAVALSPNNAVLAFSRYLELTHLPDKKRAFDAITKLITDNPTSAIYYQSRAELYFDQKDYAHALTDANKAHELDPDRTDSVELRDKIVALPK